VQTLALEFTRWWVGRHEDAMHWTKAAMIEQAIQQRNTQWAAEQTLLGDCKDSCENEKLRRYASYSPSSQIVLSVFSRINMS
jgi:hypothetical protein